MKIARSNLECQPYIEQHRAATPWSVLGRPMTDEERARAESLQALSQAQLAVAQQLSRSDAVYGQLYLGDVVKSASAREREALAEELHRSHRS